MSPLRKAKRLSVDDRQNFKTLVRKDRALNINGGGFLTG
jgi:hypothetical protein